MYRSLLYVPASNPKFVAKAADRGADAIILDLEDSIAPTDKATAREALASAIPACRRPGAGILVRVNRPIRQCVLDIEAAISAGTDAILLPKTESAEHVRFVVEVMADVERQTAGATETRLYCIIEDPAAVLRAGEIAAADARIAGLMAGGEDLATALDAEPLPETLRIPKLLVHMAAKAAGRGSYGLLGTVADFSDRDGMRALIAEARRHGYDGASCIHPAVVPLLNDGFAPSAAELATARRLVEAFEKAEAEGRGAFSLDGRMIDLPVAERARRLIARARI